jgi:hypothetical protein
MKTETFSWADVMERRDFAAIADWFIFYFFLVGASASFWSGCQLRSVYPLVENGMKALPVDCGSSS